MDSCASTTALTVPDWLADAIRSRYESLAWRDYPEFMRWLESVKASGQISAEDLDQTLRDFGDPRPATPAPIVEEEGVDTYIIDPPDPGPLAALKDHGWIDDAKASQLRLSLIDLKRLLGLGDEEVVWDVQENALHIVGRCNNPSDWGENRTGLVYGMVQSGKTASMLTVMETARRAGYRLFIILAGDKESLRAQTQSRVNKAFGLENGINRSNLVHSPTWQEDFRNLKGDYMSHFRYADRFGRGYAWTTIIVVKKNTYHLQELVGTIANLKEHMAKEDRSFAESFPAIILDDESDYASQNTDVYGSGNTIHNDIVDLRQTLDRNTYIGYTATPQACLSADPKDPVGYPKDFFWLLEPFMEKRKGEFVPRSYLGAWEVFWKYDGHIIRQVPRDEWPHYEKDRQGKSKGIYVPPLAGAHGDHVKTGRIELDGAFLDDVLERRRPEPSSFVDAMMDFMIASGIMWWRHWRQSGAVEPPSRQLIEKEYPYVAAMVHLSETQANQGKVRELVQRIWRTAVAHLRSFDHKASPASHPFRVRWTLQQERTKALRRQSLPSFGDLSWFVDRCIEIAETPINDATAKPYRPYPGLPFVYLLNSGADGMELYYDPNAASEIRVKRAGIFVGGNILSRGLTIEGLAVTVFGRASQMPLGDATLQMGRWFGHKVAYIDLVSIFVQKEIQEVMAQVADADRHLRLQIKEAIFNNHAPTEVILEMKNSAFFRITSPSKSAFLEKDKAGLGFSGRIALLKEPSFEVADILWNLQRLKKFEEASRGKTAHNRATLYENANPRLVIALLKDLRCPDTASQVTFQQYAEYLEDWLNGNGLPPFPQINVAVLASVQRRRRFTTRTRPTSAIEARESTTRQFGQIVGGQAGHFQGDAFLDKPPEWHAAHKSPKKDRDAGEPILVTFYRLHPNYVTKTLYDSSGETSRTEEVRLQPGDALFVSAPRYRDEDLAVVVFAAWTPIGGPMYGLSVNKLIDVSAAKQRGREQLVMVETDAAE